MSTPRLASLAPLLLAAALLASCTSESVGGAEAPAIGTGTQGSPAAGDSGPGDSGSGDSSSDDDRSASGTITVNAGSVSMNKWAADVSARDKTALIRKCWTFPESYIQERYLDPDPAALNEVLAAAPGDTQTGELWRGGGGEASVTFAEAKSSYACPRITFNGQEPYPDDYVAHRVERYIRRAQGKPIHPEDTAKNYWLECEVVPGSRTDVDEADPEAVKVTRTGQNRWTATAGKVTFTLHLEPSEPCIESASL